MNRRSFILSSALSLGAVSLLRSAQVFAADALKALTIKDSEVVKDGDKVNVAQFCSDAKKPSAACPERKKPERKDQFCSNCQFYTPKGLHKGQEVGSCTLIPARYVGKDAWCQTWVKKVNPA